MKKVMVFGTFDILHAGHLNFLEQARAYGDYLIAVVSRDENVKRIKGELPLNSMEKRMSALIPFVEEVAGGSRKNFFKIISEKSPDVICIGYDQETFNLEEDAVVRLNNIKIVRLKPYKEHLLKSSLLKTPENKEDAF